MSKAIQKTFDLPIPSARSESNQLKLSDKRQKVMGRPRRLKSAFKMTDAKWDNVQDSLRKGLTPEEATAEHAVPPGIIKVSIPLPMLAALDRVRKRIESSVTQPDLIRMAVERLLMSFRGGIHDCAVRRYPRPPESNGRCAYVKVLFEPATIAEIGVPAAEVKPRGREDGNPQEATGLCARLGCSRQDAIKIAIMMYLESVK